MTPAEKARTAYHCHVAQHGCGGIRRAEADRLWKLRETPPRAAPNRGL